MCTCRWPAASSASRTRLTRTSFTPVGLNSPMIGQSERSTMQLGGVEANAPEPVAEGVRHLERRAHRVVLEVHEHGHVHLVGEAVGPGARGGDGVAAEGRDQAVRHGADAAAAPPGRLRVGRDADRAGDVRRPAVAGLDQPVVVARGEEEDRLAVGRLHHLADVAHDARAPREHAEVDRLEMGEQRVVAVDLEHRLPGLDLVRLVERVHLERRPSRPSTASAPRSPRRCRRAPSAASGTPGRSRPAGGPARPGARA